MKHTIVVQLVILFLVVNPSLVSLVSGNIDRAFLGWANFLLLSWIAYTYSGYFKRASIGEGRIIFTPMVIQLLTLAISATLWHVIDYLTIANYVGSGYIIYICILAAFYIGASEVFSVYQPRRVGSVLLVRFLLAFLGLVVLSGVGLMGREFILLAQPLPTGWYASLRDGVQNVQVSLRQTVAHTNKSIKPYFRGISYRTDGSAMLEGGRAELVMRDDEAVQPDSIKAVLLPELLDAGGTDAGVETGSEASGNSVVLEGTREFVLRDKFIDPAETPLTYGQLLPVLVTTYDLVAPESAQYSFSFVLRQSPLYDAFRIARWYGMIGTTTSPVGQVRCGNLMVLIGLAEQWEIAESGNIIDAYWDVASERSLTEYGCTEQTAIATVGDLR